MSMPGRIAECGLCAEDRRLAEGPATGRFRPFYLILRIDFTGVVR